MQEDFLYLDYIMREQTSLFLTDDMAKNYVDEYFSKCLSEDASDALVGKLDENPELWHALFRHASAPRLLVEDAGWRVFFHVVDRASEAVVDTELFSRAVAVADADKLGKLLRAMHAAGVYPVQLAVRAAEVGGVSVSFDVCKAHVTHYSDPQVLMAVSKLCLAVAHPPARHALVCMLLERDVELTQGVEEMLGEGFPPHPVLLKWLERNAVSIPPSIGFNYLLRATEASPAAWSKLYDIYRNDGRFQVLVHQHLSVIVRRHGTCTESLDDITRILLVDEEGLLRLPMARMVVANSLAGCRDVGLLRRLVDLFMAQWSKTDLSAVLRLLVHPAPAVQTHVVGALRDSLEQGAPATLALVVGVMDNPPWPLSASARLSCARLGMRDGDLKLVTNLLATTPDWHTCTDLLEYVPMIAHELVRQRGGAQEVATARLVPLLLSTDSTTTMWYGFIFPRWHNAPHKSVEEKLVCASEF